MFYLINIFILSLLITNQVKAWQNWAGNQKCTPIRIFSPNTLKQLQNIIKRATNNKKQIRAIGSGHSWSDIVCTSDYLINTKKLNRILFVDKEKNQVKVQAGITLERLYKLLAQKGLALKNQAAVHTQTLAGAISTATHGSGKTGTMSSFITEIEIISADGSLIKATPERYTDIFYAACTSVGSIGIIYSLTLQCEPIFKLNSITYQTTWQKIKKEYKKLLNQNDYFQFTIDPYANKVQVVIHNKVNIDKVDKNKVDKNKTNFRQDYSFKVLSGDPGSFYLEEEIAVDKKDLIHAVESVLRLLKRYKTKNIFISNILIRFADADKNSYLSHAASRDTAFISILTPVKEKYYDFYRDFYNILLPIKGRPHWGKINYLNQNDVNWLYGDNIKNFKKVRQQLDPKGTFSSNFTKHVFGN